MLNTEIQERDMKMDNVLMTIAKKKNFFLYFLFVLFASFTDDNELKMVATSSPEEKGRKLEPDLVDESASKNAPSAIWADIPILKSIGGGGGQDDFDSGGGNENPDAYNDPTETLPIEYDIIFLCILAFIYGIYLKKRENALRGKK